MSKQAVFVHGERRGHQITREQLVSAMLEGHTFRQVSTNTPTPLKRAMAYRLLHAVRTKGKIALQDGRHGHPSKLRGEARAFLEASCQETPCTSSPSLQAALRERFDLQVSVSQINRVRAMLGVSNPSKQSPQEKNERIRGILVIPGTARRCREFVVDGSSAGNRTAFFLRDSSYPEPLHG